MSGGERCLFFFVCVWVSYGGVRCSFVICVSVYVYVAGVGEQVFDQTNTMKIRKKNEIFGWIYRNQMQNKP